MRKTRMMILGRIRVMRRNEDDVISKTYKANVGKRKAPHDRVQAGEVEPARRTSTIFIYLGPNWSKKSRNSDCWPNNGRHFAQKANLAETHNL